METALTVLIWLVGGSIALAVVIELVIRVFAFWKGR